MLCIAIPKATAASTVPVVIQVHTQWCRPPFCLITISPFSIRAQPRQSRHAELVTTAQRVRANRTISWKPTEARIPGWPMHAISATPPPPRIRPSGRMLSNGRQPREPAVSGKTSTLFSDYLCKYDSDVITRLLERIPNIDIKDGKALDELMPWSPQVPDDCKAK